MKKSKILDDNLFLISHEINLLKYFIQLPCWCGAIFLIVYTGDDHSFLKTPGKWWAAGPCNWTPDEDPGTEPIVEKSGQDADEDAGEEAKKNQD